MDDGAPVAAATSGDAPAPLVTSVSSEVSASAAHANGAASTALSHISASLRHVAPGASSAFESLIDQVRIAFFDL